MLNNFTPKFMNNIIKIKKQVKACIKKEDLKSILFFVVSFDNTSLDKENSFKITKNQYIQSDISALVNKKNLKFPLGIKQFKNQAEIVKSVNADKKNSISLVKINSYLFLGKKALSLHLTDMNLIYSKFNNIMLSMVRFLKLLKYLNDNKEKIK